MTLKAGALFSGIGGFCLGFAQAGIPTTWAVENDESASNTYSHNITNARLLTKNVELVGVNKDELEPVDVLHAGFPCQSFSQAGERKGFDDPRGKLFNEIIRLIKEFKDRKPKILVLENAPFLRYGEGGQWFLKLQTEIQKAGYWFRDQNCAELNAFKLTQVPQQRVRLFMVALSQDYFLSGRFSFPSIENTEEKNLENFIDFDADAPDNYYLHHENRYHKMISETVIEKRALYQLRKYLVRVKEPGVCPTLTANMGLGGHNVPFIMGKNGLRKLTEQECLRLQGFPKDFLFPDNVPRAKRYTQVGNAVCVPVAELLATKVRSKLEECLENV